MADQGYGRRTLLVGAGAALCMPWVARAQGGREAVKVSVGRIPWAAFNSPMTQYMIENKLFEKRAAELGYDLTVDWREYPTALPMVEAIVGNNLDMGMWGNTPIIRAISAKLPISLMVVGEGHLRFVLATRKDSPIRTIQDIKGKTVGALLGGDPYNALSQMLRWELGSANPRDNGLRIVNTPTLAQAAQVPTGLDAAIAIYPAFLAAQSTGTVGIMNSFGYTEDYYKGPLGEGGGILLPSVKKSPFFPDGYYLHRSFWLVNNGLLDKTPKVVLAFLMAQQDSVSALKAMDAPAVSQLVKEYWKLDPVQGGKVVNDDVLYLRGWAWPTEADARAVLETSKYLVDAKMIQAPLAWAQVKEAFKRTAPLVKQAYDQLGAKPPDSEFTRTDVTDLRGHPVWEMDRWADVS
ncbi:MAG: ABC transporter substrate-binding protein [Acetobacteraceae bacterium]|nr:ABC transporter substrate-binding protein [Acetobacteraceae bacterium]